jgi:hypothetical protein
MDLANLDTAKFGSRGSWMDVLHPSGDGTALVDEQSKETVALHLRGADAPETTTAQRERVQRRLDRRRQRQTADDIDDDLLETAVAATIGWRYVFFEGKYLPYSEDNVRMLYRKFRWILEQALTYLSNRANYLGEPSTSSLPSPGVSSKTGNALPTEGM